jgi:hypothetical protein
MGSEGTAVCGVDASSEWSMVEATRPYRVCWYNSTVVEHELLLARLREKLPCGTQLFGCRECLCRRSGLHCYWLIVLLPDGSQSRFEEEIQSVVEDLDNSGTPAVELQPAESRDCHVYTFGCREHPRFQFGYCADGESSAQFVGDSISSVKRHWLSTHVCGELFEWFGSMKFREIYDSEELFLWYGVKRTVCTLPQRLDRRGKLP